MKVGILFSSGERGNDLRSLSAVRLREITLWCNLVSPYPLGHNTNPFLKIIPMKFNSVTFALICHLLISHTVFSQNWIRQKDNGFNLFYTAIDSGNITEYNQLVDKGIQSTKSFFGGNYKTQFDILIHPNRHSLDSTWQQDWKMPDFKSECWMVASGVAAKLDVIAPKRWDKDACEHVYSDSDKTQRLITHELVHVYHGQLNVSPDFSNVEGIDWFVEGLATHASGQCDSQRMGEIKKAIAANQIPVGLDNFWTGKLKYGLSGSMVMYIDHHFGRAKLKELLAFNKKSDILQCLNTTETALLRDWKKYIETFQPH